MAEGDVIVQMGHVVSVYDDADGLRIKVKLKLDSSTPDSDLPYCFPLLHKAFQSVPKVGEGAFVLLSKSGNKESQRYYLGPIISQPQFNNKCNYQHGRGNATTLLNGGTISPLERISNYKETFGAFPEVNDVAVVGRGGQDIILKQNEENGGEEIDLRCGIRSDSVNGDKRDGTAIVGNVVFNSVDPAYVQLKYKKGISTGDKIDANSLVNVVADKINIISNQDANGLKLTDTKTLIPEDKMSDIMNKLHQLPHGDTLVECLTLIINAIVTHVHHFDQTTPVQANYVQELANYDPEKILSEHVRIS